MAKKRGFKQETYLVGKVTWAKKDTGESEKKGTPYNRYTFLVNSPEGVSVVVSKTVWNPKVEHKSDWVMEKRALLEKLAGMTSKEEDYKIKEDLFISISIRPAKDGTMFDALSVFEKENGDYSIKFEGFPTVLKSTPVLNEDEEVKDYEIHFKKKTKLFSELKTRIKLEMIVLESSGDKLELCSEDTEYPTMVTVHLHEDLENKAKKFSAYKMSGVLKKGERVDSEKVESDWGATAEDTSDYGTDYIEITRVEGAVPNLKMNGVVEEDDEDKPMTF